MKDIDKYKESGVPWIGEIPKDWQIPVLKRTTYIKGRIGWQGLTSEEYRSDGNYHLITGTDFDNGKIRWESCWYVDEARYSEDENIQLCEDDVLITKDGTIGKIAIVENMPSKATLNSGVFVTRPLKKQYLQRFMFWVLNSDLFPEFIEYSKVGTTIAHLYQKTFERFIYPLPSLSEQRRIAAYLDKICAAIYATIETKRKQLETLDALRKSIIHRAVTRGLDDSVELKDSGVEWIGKIPKHWRISGFKRVFKVIYRYPTYYNIEYVSEGVPEIRGEALNNDGLITKLETERYISPDTNALFPRTQLSRGDVVMSVRGTMGKIGLVDDNYVGANITANLLRLSPKSRIVDGRFLRWFFMSEYFLQSLAATSPQTTIKTITMPQLAKIPLLIAPISEQIVIAEYLDARITEIKMLKHNLNTQIKVLNQFRKSLIHECVTGKRRITKNNLKQIG